MAGTLRPTTCNMVRNVGPASTTRLRLKLEGVGHSIMDLGMDCTPGPSEGDERGHFILLHSQQGQLLC
jgi:hypothetical protein